jgi:hypothetical protein
MSIITVFFVLIVVVVVVILALTRARSSFAGIRFLLILAIAPARSDSAILSTLVRSEVDRTIVGCHTI